GGGRGGAPPRPETVPARVAMPLAACERPAGRLAGKARHLVARGDDLLVGQADEAGLLGDAVDVLDVEVDERLDLRPPQRLSRRVDVELAAERRVLAALRRLRRRRHA